MPTWGERWLWWKPGWVATPSASALHRTETDPIVTTAATIDPIELVQVYTHTLAALDGLPSQEARRLCRRFEVH